MITNIARARSRPPRFRGGRLRAGCAPAACAGRAPARAPARAPVVAKDCYRVSLITPDCPMIVARPASSRATGTRNGEHDT